MDSQASTSNGNRKRKSKTLTLVEKVRVIEDFEKGGATHDSLGKKYGIGSSTVARLIQKKQEIRAAANKFKEYGVDNRKTLKGQTFPLLEEVLYVWILKQRHSNILLPVDIIKTKAELLFKTLQDRGHYAENKFSASDGWVHRFKQRFGFGFNETSITNAEDPTFSDAMKSLDVVIRYMKHDAAEVSRLTNLRAKIIEAEWLKRTS